MNQRPLIVKIESGDFLKFYNKKEVIDYFDENRNVKSVDIIQWGNSIHNYFSLLGFINGLDIKTITASDLPTLKIVVSMFRDCKKLESINNIEKWDLSNVKKDMTNMFYNCHSFNANLSNWNISNIINMSWMFKEASSFNSDISNWNVSNVISMGYMFLGASSFNSDLSNWNVSNVTNMSWMFFEASSFNSDISNWNVSNVEYMNYMFRNATNFNSDLSNWNMINVKEYYNMFEGCKNPNKELLRILKLRDL